MGDRDWLATEAASRPAKDIARLLGVATDTVISAMRDHGIPVAAGTALNRAGRRPELNDREWLAERYAHQSTNDIAAELGVSVSSVLRALRAHQIPVRDRTAMQQFRRPEPLRKTAWLAEQYTTKSGREIADETGMSVRGVYKAMQAAGIEADGPWVRRNTKRLHPPPTLELEQAWDVEQSVKGVARRYGVSGTTAETWLADIGIFVNEVPALSRRQLEVAIRDGLTIEGIARRHRVGPRTVKVELRRHQLVVAHRHRPRPR